MAQPFLQAGAAAPQVHAPAVQTSQQVTAGDVAVRDRIVRVLVASGAPDVAVADAKLEDSKAVAGYGGFAHAGGTQALLQGLFNQAVGIGNQIGALANLPNQVGALANQMAVLDHKIENNRAVVYNSGARPGEELMLLRVVAAGGPHPVGTLPGQGVPFPNTLAEASQLTMAELNALEVFYNQPFAGQNVEERHAAFGKFIGVRMESCCPGH
ncbi:hypothetical protein HYH03_005458 [Edaphochlamys debaryana]|uniref:Uncharacterized protein n=1 Tax=Edaphochlamys debaryana TaxID=47281 RepID=A0A835Y601_9CHLO|nr:hypothetical protein HYH03_005458 [Edaphochlamys debaryana]|eukprot:KAG2496638.1 hypothetical protein HYH03_005458 [Edaphochlamys debaryana]